MKLGRRGLLALAVAGCAPDPTIVGDPAPAPPAPTQSPAARAGAEALAGLAAAVHAGRATADLGAGYPDWADAAEAAVAALLVRLRAVDPVAGGDAVFPGPPVAVNGYATAEDAAAGLAAAADRAAATLRAGALGALAQPLRLLYASAACAAHGLRAVGPAPTVGDAEPGHFQDTSEGAALTVALSHFWALIYGLGVGLGRLPSRDPLRAHGAARLARAREVRNELRAAFTTAPLQPAVFELPTRMLTVDEIRDGWGLLELSALEGLGRLVAAGGRAAPKRLDHMLAQAVAVTAVGRPLPHWPGWA